MFSVYLGNLGEAMNKVGDLYTLACKEDDTTWWDVLVPNIQYMLVCILRGVEYLHKSGYQHRDLKGTCVVFLPVLI